MSVSREDTLDPESGTPSRYSYSQQNIRDSRPTVTTGSNNPEGTSIQIVVFSEDDPEDPRNWSSRRKVSIVAILCILVFVS